MIGSLNEEIDRFLSSLTGLEETALNQIKDRYSSTFTDELSKGHLTTNVCMIAASQLKKNPKDLADDLQKKLIDSGKFENVETAGPGFINITLTANKLGVTIMLITATTVRNNQHQKLQYVLVIWLAKSDLLTGFIPVQVLHSLLCFQFCLKRTFETITIKCSSLGCSGMLPAFVKVDTIVSSCIVYI